MKINSFCQKILLIVLLASFSSAFAEDASNNLVPQAEPIVFSSTGNVQLLNKNTAKVEKIFLQVKKPAIINNLEITLHKCWQAPEYQKPESKMLLEVSEIYQDKKTPIFFGWLFASSPSVSSLEHPIYDLVALNCLKEK